MSSASALAATWARGLALRDIPQDLLDATKLRILDYLGLALAAGSRAPGQAMRSAARAMGQGGPSHIIGFGDAVTPAAAALANGTLATCLVFDDTHQETIIHITTPVASSAFAASEATGASGAEFLTAVVAGSELLCRLGLIAPKEFHKHGLHPTGILGAFASAFAASRLFGLDESQTRSAIGIVASMASGISEAFADGTWSHLMNAGWGAQNGIAAALVARQGFSGPGTAIEGRFGLFRSHLQDPAVNFDFGRLTRDLGETWESRSIVHKLYPCAHVILPFLDCVAELVKGKGLRAANVKRMTCHIADWMVPVVCEPVGEKRRPVSDFQARTSLQFSLAEALVRGRLGPDAYTEESLRDGAIHALADRIDYAIDENAPGSGQYKGWVVVETTDGATMEHVVVYDGSADADVAAKVRWKFRECLAMAPKKRDADTIEAAVMNIEKAPSVAALMELCT
jgi:2-methylcitrate dehydratase PrpD